MRLRLFHSLRWKMLLILTLPPALANSLQDAMIGLRFLFSWGRRASLNIVAGIEGASSACGKRIQFTGNAAYFFRLTNRTDFVSGFSSEADGTMGVMTLWWSPPRGTEARSAVVR